ncbi:hypothetical protein [Calothrix sp. NIES-2098]|uniref:hypothetical protein n=1 Tax=Calothrix sp. NIES-2098 TaxID=1954171 RepID=UPI000B61DEE9|nr:hypothetical protein NIES2098_72140 [Calothrix sp. NIES-2098]
MTKLVTPRLLKTYLAIKESPNWLTADSIAEISGNKPDTVRKHVRYLSREKVLEVFEMRPAYYYQLSQNISDIWVVQQLEVLLTTVGS